MNKKAVAFQSEKPRYVIGWILIILFAITIAIFCVYNKSAFMMLFGKTRINLNDYKTTVSYIYKNPANFTNVLSTENEELSSISYETTDNIYFFNVKSSNNQICFIDANVDVKKFLSLSLIEKYKVIDKVLQPIFNKSDIFASEIGILKILSQLAFNELNFLNFNFYPPQNIQFNSSSNSYAINLLYKDDVLNLKLSVK